MAKTICKKAVSVPFPLVQALDGTQKLSRQDYPCSATMVSPCWRVLDIGADSGILSLPLCAIGCDSTTMEPSIGMRSFLYEEALNRGIDGIRGSEEKLEDVPLYYL